MARQLYVVRAVDTGPPGAEEPPPGEPPAESPLLSIPWWRSFVLRFVGIYSVCFTGLLLVSIHWLYRLEEREVVDKFGLALESIAATAAPSIPGDLIAEIRSDTDASGPAFQGLRARLESVRRENHLREDQVYILRPDPDDPRIWRFAVMLQQTTFVGDPYVPPSQVKDLYRWAFDHRDAVRTPLFTDAHGTFISGIAPVLDGQGRAVALLQVDYSLDTYMAEVDRQAQILLAGLGGLLVCLTLIGVWMYRYMRAKVLAVLEGTQAITREDYDHRITVPGQDELATIASALNRVLTRLKERFEMLKFLPRHTTRMIQAAARGDGVTLENSRRVRVAILESDIRGFTAISERLKAEEVIFMLNRYIRAQAEWIEAFGGSIDKYMGDAVLAVFEGPRGETDAIECALAIQREVLRLNDAGAFQEPIHIGVGVSVGEVVMGNIGSEQRMEHTVIGAPVNLAARLCSAAGQDEIVLQAEVWEAMEDHPALDLGELERITVKGFADPVRCYRHRVEAG